MNNNEIYRIGKVFAFKCAACGKVEPHEGAEPFKNDGEAKVALRLHKIGCKRS